MLEVAFGIFVAISIACFAAAFAVSMDIDSEDE